MLAFGVDVQTGVPRFWTGVGFVTFAVGTLFLYDGPKLSWITLFGFFVIPFVFLLFRKVKDERPLLGAVAAVIVVGIFLARFIEIAPPLLHLPEGAPLGDALVPLAAAVLVFLGFLGVGLLGAATLLTRVPAVTLATVEEEESHG